MMKNNDTFKGSKAETTLYGDESLLTDRLYLLPLSANSLEQLCVNLPALEKDLKVTYAATPVEGVFSDILKMQLNFTREDEVNYKWHTFWLIIRQSDMVVVGMADFKDVPNENGEVEIGYGLGEAFTNNGYMTEAVKAMCEWAFRQKNVSAVIAETELNGVASQNILKNCGFIKYSENKTAWWRLLK